MKLFDLLTEPEIKFLKGHNRGELLRNCMVKDITIEELYDLYTILSAQRKMVVIKQILKFLPI